MRDSPPDHSDPRPSSKTPRGRALLGWLAVLSLGLAMVLLGPFSGATVEHLAYERAAVLSGEWWRLLSAHLVHSNWSHLWLNLASVAVVLLVFPRLAGRGEVLFASMGSICAISAGLVLLEPQLAEYTGFSGAVYGLVAAGAWRVRRHNLGLAVLALAYLAVKTALEQLNGPPAYMEAFVGGRVIVNAHLYGILGGLAAAVLWERLEARRKPTGRE